LQTIICLIIYSSEIEEKVMSEQNKILNDHALDVLFREARTFNSWQDKEVSDVLIKSLYDLFKWGPTSMNCSPARLIFIKGKEAKERLEPYLMEGNKEKTMSAPVTAIIANDMRFFDQLPKLFPHNKEAKNIFEGKEGFIKDTAFRNATLQGAYLICAARSLGLDCGPMSGFNKKGVNEEFFKDQDIEANFLCNLGYGSTDSLYPRGPRLEFDEVCSIL
jgi:3-hydroxypropanoate dehydrogenase